MSVSRRSFLASFAGYSSLGSFLQGCGGGGTESSTPSTLPRDASGASSVHVLLNKLSKTSIATPSRKITEENLLLGTLDWQLSTPPKILTWDTSNSPFPAGDIDRNTQRCPIVEGYAWPASVNLGETISFYISTTARSYSLKIFRMGWYQGLGARLMPGASWSNISTGGSDHPQPTPTVPQSNQRASDHDGWGDASNWMPANLDGTGTTIFRIPDNWVSGCYLAKLEESTTGTQSYIFFVVRDDLRSSDIILQIPYATYHAYNGWGGKSNYGYNNLGTLTGENWLNGGAPSGLIWFRRPFLPSNSPSGNRGAGAGAFLTLDKGIGGSLTWEASGRDRSAAGGGICSGVDYNVIRWLEREGMDVTYCISLDSHQGQLLRSAHQVYISVGHDEYLSLQQYDYLKKARDEIGTSLIWLSGNSVWCAMNFDVSRGCMSGTSPKTGNFFRNLKDRSCYSMLGTGWSFGGTPGQADDYLVTYDCPDWLMNQTKMALGATAGKGLIGYEGDGLNPTYSQYYPPGLKMIARNQKNTVHAVTYTSRKSGASVFSMSSIQYGWGLDDFSVATGEAGPGARENADIQQITRNMINDQLLRKYMVADLPAGFFSVHPADQKELILACDSVGDIFLESKLAAEHTGTWKVDPYVPTSAQKLAAIGPYKAATSDHWYTLSCNGNVLCASDAALQNSPVGTTIKTASLGSYWRIWRNTLYTTADKYAVYLLQNVGTGQLLCFRSESASTALPTQSADMSWIASINATIDGWSVDTPIHCSLQGPFHSGVSYWFFGSDGTTTKAVKIELSLATNPNQLGFRILASKSLPGVTTVTDPNSVFAGNDAKSEPVSTSKVEPGIGLRDLEVLLVNGSRFHLRGINGGYVSTSMISPIELSNGPLVEQRGDYNMGYGEVDYAIEKYWVLDPA